MTAAAEYEVDGAIATVTLNRPERLNAMNEALLEGTLAALERAADDDSIRVVILTGAGRGFCAGGDLSSMAGGNGAGLPQQLGMSSRVDRLRRYVRSSQLLHEMPKVTIAAVNGACAGAGLAWACACDLRYCAESARFNTAFMTAGLSGDFGGTWTLPRIVGPARARELYFLAEKFSSEDAERIGLVSRRLPDADLMGHVRGIAARLVSFAPLTLRAIKANLVDSERLCFSEMLDRESERHVGCGMTDDAKEAAAAFLEKREALFVGR
jgi:2-(1,2-epoxy-1,2-dihydrophenyl)acetyl-CoA isomerase